VTAGVFDCISTPFLSRMHLQGVHMIYLNQACLLEAIVAALFSVLWHFQLVLSFEIHIAKIKIRIGITGLYAFI
jgi:hypothetical protein